MVNPPYDARYNTKAWITTYLTAANIKKDDGSTNCTCIVAYGYPDYPLERVFSDKDVDVVFSIGTPNTVALPVGVGYLETVPITITCVNKTGVTGTEARWKAEAELRRITETYPTGSLRYLDRLVDNEERVGATIFYSVTST
jgi:hypothetical protein